MALSELFAKSGVRFASALASQPRAPSRSCDWPELDRLLPDGGFPFAVIEIASESASLAGATAVAVAAVRAAHKRDARSWCAWIDANRTLYAPGLARGGVALERLLVVRPKMADVARVVVKSASSGAFDVLIVDGGKPSEVMVRKLALAAEQQGTTILMLSSPLTRSRSPLPVALRLEVSRTLDGLQARITKDRHGRLMLAKTSIPIVRSWECSA